MPRSFEMTYHARGTNRRCVACGQSCKEGNVSVSKVEDMCLDCAKAVSNCYRAALYQKGKPLPLTVVAGK